MFWKKKVSISELREQEFDEVIWPKIQSTIKDKDELLNNICRIIVEEGGYALAWVGMSENDEFKSSHTAFEPTGSPVDTYLSTIADKISSLRPRSSSLFHSCFLFY